MPKSWSSRSLRSVRTTKVGLAISGMLDDLARVKGHRQALAAALGVPDDADPPVPLGAAASTVQATALLTAWYWW